MKYFIIILILIFLISLYLFSTTIRERFSSKKRFAICFFGLTKSLKHTIESIKTNILNELDNNNIEYDIYIHTYNLKNIYSNRNKENTELNINEYKLLNPSHYKIENQDDFDKKYNYEYLYKYGDTWNNNFESLHNLIRQLNSLQNVFNLTTKFRKYDYYLMLRPDLKYNDKINIKLIFKNINKEHLLIPNFGWNGSILNGNEKMLNDRFVFGTFESIKKYSNKIN